MFIDKVLNLNIILKKLKYLYKATTTTGKRTSHVVCMIRLLTYALIIKQAVDGSKNSCHVHAYSRCRINILTIIHKS